MLCCFLGFLLVKDFRKQMEKINKEKLRKKEGYSSGFMLIKNFLRRRKDGVIKF